MRTNLRPAIYNYLIINYGSGTHETIVSFVPFIFLKKL
nr:MAG TPA: hypothetical protein [Caudoviricetes sp.]